MANPEIISISFNTPREAKEKYLNIPEGLKLDMAEVYKLAFGGKPWYERYLCKGTDECGFLKDAFCPKCQSDKTVTEAYPTEWLVKEYFEEMLSTFVPGILGILQLGEETPGFTTGGFSTLNTLISKKYGKRAETVLASIARMADVKPETLVFYDNETCINPLNQGQGLGPKLSEYRISEAISLGAEVVCGRTINATWLKTKERQFREKGFDFIYFVPEGDTYEVNGNPRYFYIATLK